MEYTYAQIKDMANRLREIPLIDVIDITGAIRDKYDKRKWHSSQGTISITGQKFMNWSIQKGGGGAIDLIMHLEQLNFKSAVIWLSNYFSRGNLPPPHYIQPAINSIFHIPEKNKKNLPQVINYLNQKRKIPIYLIQELIDSGNLYADNRLNAVFLLIGKEKKVVGAELRGTSQKRWRGMALGSKKNLGAFSIKAQTPKNIIICESAIDAVSYFALYPDCIAVSTSGVTATPGWLYELIKIDIELFCGFDDDEAGNKNAEEIIRLFPKIKRLKPEKHDWNEVLKLRLKCI